MINKENQLLRAKDVATLFNCSPSKIYAMHHNGELHGTLIGKKTIRFKESDITKILQGACKINKLDGELND